MNRWIFVLGILVFTLTTKSFAQTTQVDALVEKLVEKGILTKAEAIELKGEIAADEKIVREEGLKQSLPEWVQKMKLKGDFRLRYQYERRENDADARSRGRIRYRLGLETDVLKNLKVGAGLASGADDPRATNQTFTDTFERSDIRLDYAFTEYTPLSHDKGKISLIGGIHPRANYLWTPTDLLWDSDITTHGGAAHGEYKISPAATLYVNSGVWVIDEISSTTSDRVDPFMHYGQGGVQLKKGSFSFNLAGVYYGFNGLKGTCPDWSSATNTGITTASSGSCTGALRYDYDSAGTSVELGWEKPFHLPFEELAIFGDFIANIDNNDDEGDNSLDDTKAWAMGARLGDKKVNGKSQWQLKYLFANLGRDAWPDFLPDSDRYGGRTDVRSHEWTLDYGLNKNVVLGFDYYNSRRLDRAAKNGEHLLQTDLNVKF